MKILKIIAITASVGLTAFLIAKLTKSKKESTPNNPPNKEERRINFYIKK